MVVAAVVGVVAVFVAVPLVIVLLQTVYDAYYHTP